MESHGRSLCTWSKCSSRWNPVYSEQGVHGRQDYKTAILEIFPEDIVLTSRTSGTPCTFINTPIFKRWVQTSLFRYDS